MKIPQSLLDARAALDAQFQRQETVQQRASGMAAGSKLAAARVTELGHEIEGTRDALLEDDALSGVANDQRMPAAVRGETEQRLAALIAERDALADQARRDAASASALTWATAAREPQVIEAARAFAAEWRAIERSAQTEFHRDVGRLTLPQLLKKWFAIADGLSHYGMIERLKGITINNGSPILFEGRYRDLDTDTAIDWKSAWRSDAAFVELHDTLAIVGASARRASAMVKAADESHRQTAERQRLDEAQRSARLASAPKSSRGGYVTPPAPAPAAPAYRGVAYDAVPGY